MTGADRSGFWHPGDEGKGGVRRVASPVEIAFGLRDMVIVQDLSNMEEAQNHDKHITEKFSMERN